MGKVSITKDACKGCQLCIAFCPTKHLVLSRELNKRGVRYAKAKEETKCVACGFCFLVCPDACLEIYTET
ncbi:MAG: 4Fe-4S dicluster domain-containing protein [Candidatus Omnitrophota bacterium]